LGSVFGEQSRVRFSVLVPSSFRSNVMFLVAFFIRVVILAVLVFLERVPADPTTAVNQSRTKSHVGANRQPVQCPLRSILQSAEPLLSPSQVGAHRQPLEGPLQAFPKFDVSSRSSESPFLQSEPLLSPIFSNSSSLLNWQSKEQWQILERRNVSAFKMSVFVRKVVVWEVTTITSIEEVNLFKAQHLPVSHSRSIACRDVATVMLWQDFKPFFEAFKNRCLVQVWTSNDLIDSNIPGRRGRLGRTNKVHCFIFEQSKFDYETDMFVFIAAHRSSHCQSRYHQRVLSMHMLQPRTKNREQ
jgi:hypothetical protein